MVRPLNTAYPIYLHPPWSSSAVLSSTIEHELVKVFKVNSPTIHYSYIFLTVPAQHVNIIDILFLVSKVKTKN